MADQGRDVINRANFRGLWSVNNIDCLPSNMKLKFAERGVSCKHLTVEGGVSGFWADNFLE